MNIEELKVLGEKWANLPDCKAANEIADEVMDKLPELLQEMQQLEKACAEMRSLILRNLRAFANVSKLLEAEHALSSACGSDYIHRDEIKPLVEALDKLARLGNEPMFGNSNGNRIAQEALAHAENLLKGETK